MIDKIDKKSHTLSKKRIEFWQLVRGICIIAVIFIHCPNALNSKIKSDYATWLVLRQVFNFPVPIFIFLAGYFNNIDKNHNNYRKYLSQRLKILIIPYLFWTCIYTIIYIIINNVRFENMINLLLHNFLTGKAASPLYFILLLLQMEIILPVIREIENHCDKKIRILIWLITPLYLIYLYFFYFMYKTAPSLYGTLFPAYLNFYLIGLKLQKNNEVNEVKYLANIFLLLATFVLSIFECFLLSSLGMPSFGASQLKISSFLYSFIIIMILFINKNRKINNKSFIYRILLHLGNDSYALFYVHCLVMIPLRKLLNLLQFPWVIEAFICLFLTIVLSEFAIILVRKIAGFLQKENYLKIFGF